MTEMTTVHAAGHHTAKHNGTWLYRGAAAQEPAVTDGSHVHPDVPGGTAQPSDGATASASASAVNQNNQQMCASLN
jgi:hypothetical protein